MTKWNLIMHSYFLSINSLVTISTSFKLPVRFLIVLDKMQWWRSNLHYPLEIAIICLKDNWYGNIAVWILMIVSFMKYQKKYWIQVMFACSHSWTNANWISYIWFRKFFRIIKFQIEFFIVDDYFFHFTNWKMFR